MATNVRYKDRIRIQELSAVKFASEDDFIDSSKKDSSNKPHSYKLQIQNLYKYGGTSNPGLLVTDAAARRYHTDANELSAADLNLFAKYEQDEVPGRALQKNVYFEKFPIVDSPKNVYELAKDQLLTKQNIPEFQDYVINKQLTNYASIPANNWENESESTHVKSFLNFISKTKHDARATYKIMFDDKEKNPERVSNIVTLSKLKEDPNNNEKSISAAVHYSVAGVVSVKSNLKEQRSGTIYLEARKTGSKDDWQTIDSAVFKFVSKSDWSDISSRPGTYVTLSGYLYTDFETRLKINLHPHAYSMNLNDYRDTDFALTNHYSNTFIGFIDIPNSKSDTESNIYFTNINYAGYLYGKNAIQFLKRQVPNATTTSRDAEEPYPYVSDLITQFHPSEGSYATEKLEISTKTQDLIFNATNFAITGLRLSPMGKVYGMNERIPVENGMTVYPAYTSGTIKTPRPSNISFVTSYGDGIAWQQNSFLNNINYSQLSVISGLQWPDNTDICGNINLDISAKNTEYGTTTVDDQTGTYTRTPKTSKRYTVTARSVATENPRVQYPVDRQSIHFEPRGELASNVTCHISASPRTSGDGRGNESYGRILKVNSNGSTSIVNEVTLNTKNVSVKMTDGLCTGSRWNIHERSLITADIIMPRNGPHYFNVEAAADTAADDGKRETIFTVSVSAVFDYYVKTFVPNPPHTEHWTNIQTASAGVENKMNCSVLYDRYAYADKVISSHVDTTTLTNNFNVQQLSVTQLNFKRTSDSSVNQTQLSVLPHPQSVSF